jgi:DNA primase
LVDKVSNSQVVEFIDSFGINKSFPNTYFVKRISEALALGETNAAAKLIIAKQLFSDFDLPQIVEKLAEKGPSNRKLAVELLYYCP